MNAKRYAEAVLRYSAALSLDPASPHDLLIKRSNAWANMGAPKDSLNDAKEWTRLMLTSGSWQDALTAGVSVTILLLWHPLYVSRAWPVVYARKIHNLSGCM